MTKITDLSEVAKRLVPFLAKGFCNGPKDPESGRVCVMVAINMAEDPSRSMETATDSAECASRVATAYAIRLNDSFGWSSPEARAKGTRRLAFALLGSNIVDDQALLQRLVNRAHEHADHAVKVSTPKALRAAATFWPDGSEHKLSLLGAAERCEAAPSIAAADAAARAAAADAADAAARAAAARAAAARAAAARAAAAAADAAAADPRPWWEIRSAEIDAALTASANEVADILTELGSPGLQYMPQDQA